MKRQTTLKFANACIDKNENGDFIITETVKDEEKVYNLTERLEEFVGIDGISLQMGKVDDVPSEV